jgi:hypothetical protein
MSVWYSVYAVLGFVSKSLRDRRLQTHDPEALHISSTPISETVSCNGLLLTGRVTYTS